MADEFTIPAPAQSSVDKIKAAIAAKGGIPTVEGEEKTAPAPAAKPAPKAEKPAAAAPTAKSEPAASALSKDAFGK